MFLYAMRRTATARSSGFDVDVLKRAMAHSAEIH